LPCYTSASGAVLKYGEISSTTAGLGYQTKDPQTGEIKTGQIEVATIVYKLQGENAESASNIVTILKGKNNEQGV